MTRSDLESIYVLKNSNQDRKNDLTITPLVHQVLDNWNCLDVNIENTSNKSINFHIEMMVFTSGCKTMSGDEFDKLMKINSYKEPINPYKQSFQFEPTNIHYRITTKSDYIHIQSNLIRGFTINQNSIDKNAFDREIYVQGQDLEIKAQITLRSDDFTDGSLIKDIKFKI